MDHLQEIYGIGPVTAKTLLLRIRRLGWAWSGKLELFALLRKPIIFDTLPEAAQAYLTYMPDRAIPYAVMEMFDKALHKAIVGMRFVIAGSYRRARPYSRDVDIVMIGRFETFVKKLAQSTNIKILQIFAQGDDKVSVMFRFNLDNAVRGRKKYTIKADIFITPKSEYIYTLLYATGSGAFNIRMRAQAKRKGYLLNQRGLFDRAGNRITGITNERQIFNLIGVTYKLPPDRA